MTTEVLRPFSHYNLTTMNSFIKAGLGIDIGSETNYARLYLTDIKTGQPKRIGKRKFPNTAKGHLALFNWAKKKTPTGVKLIITMEATGVYHEPLAYFLTESSMPVSIVLPNKIKSFSASFNEHSKTDWIDADMIARYAHDRQPKAWSPSAPSMREVKKLSRERQQVVGDISAAKNRLHAEMSSGKPMTSILNRYQKHIELLEVHREEIAAEIDRLCREDEKLGKMVLQLNTIYGVDTITSVAILAETDGFRLFTKRSQLVKYAGYDIVEKESGTSVHGKSRISKRGNSHIRKVLHFPAMTAIRQEGIFQEVYERVFEQSRCKMKALVAVQRKLLITMYALVKNESEYQVNYHKERQLVA